MSNVSERQMWMLTRRSKHIKLKEIASHIGCSISLLSRWETDTCDISDEKFNKYKEFISSR